MDKYEYTVKADKIKQLVSRKDYATAAKIADGIDWSRVQDVRMLMMVAEAFEKNGQYEKRKKSFSLRMIWSRSERECSTN